MDFENYRVKSISCREDSKSHFRANAMCMIKLLAKEGNDAADVSKLGVHQ
jgi:hypothetical protein